MKKSRMQCYSNCGPGRAFGSLPAIPVNNAPSAERERMNLEMFIAVSQRYLMSVESNNKY